MTRKINNRILLSVHVWSMKDGVLMAPRLSSAFCSLGCHRVCVCAAAHTAIKLFSGKSPYENIPGRLSIALDLLR